MRPTFSWTPEPIWFVRMHALGHRPYATALRVADEDDPTRVGAGRDPLGAVTGAEWARTEGGARIHAATAVHPPRHQDDRYDGLTSPAIVGSAPGRGMG